MERSSNPFSRYDMERSSNPSSWSKEDVSAYLESINLSQYISSFVLENVDGEFLLKHVDDEEVMKDLGIIKKLHRKRLLFELQKIQSTNLDDKGLKSTDGDLIRNSKRSIPLRKLDDEEVEKSSKIKKIITKKISNIPIKNNETGGSNKKKPSTVKVDKSEIKTVKKRGRPKKNVDKDDNADLIFENKKSKKQKTTPVLEVSETVNEPIPIPQLSIERYEF
jgi:hypothetical protein